MTFSLANILEIIIIYQSALFVIFLYFDKTSKPLFIKALIAICIVIIAHFSYILLEEKLAKSTIFLGPFFGLLYGPLYFVYSKSLIVENTKVVQHRIHFFLAIILLPIIVIYNKLPTLIITSIGLLVTIHIMSYLSVCLYSISNYRKHLQNELSSFQHINLFWLEVIIYIQFGTLLVTLMESFFRSRAISDILIVFIFILVLILINCFYYLGIKHVRLYKGIVLENETIGVTEYTISDDLFKIYSKKLIQFIETNKPYLEYNITLDQLAKELSISKRNISHVINKQFQLNFYDFINQFRLKKAKEDLRNTEKSIKEIMYDSGFANKASFNLVFKKHTGVTPTQFRAQKTL